MANSAALLEHSAVHVRTAQDAVLAGSDVLSPSVCRPTRFDMFLGSFILKILKVCKHHQLPIETPSGVMDIGDSLRNVSDKILSHVWMSLSAFDLHSSQRRRYPRCVSPVTQQHALLKIYPNPTMPFKAVTSKCFVSCSLSPHNASVWNPIMEG